MTYEQAREEAVTEFEDIERALSELLSNEAVADVAENYVEEAMTATAAARIVVEDKPEEVNDA